MLLLMLSTRLCETKFAQKDGDHVHVASHAFRLPATLPPASSFTASYAPKWTACAGPAPMITEDTPLQSARAPSVLEMRVNAFPMPVYTADGEVAKTCIRVYSFTKCRQLISVRPGSLSAYVDAHCAREANRGGNTHFDTVYGEHNCMFCNAGLRRSVVSPIRWHSTPDCPSSLPEQPSLKSVTHQRARHHIHLEASSGSRLVDSGRGRSRYSPQGRRSDPAPRTRSPLRPP